jgi:hypothetical protein
MREEEPGTIRNELLERLRGLESSQSQSGLAEMAYRRAREALERALEEARSVRLQAIEDARLTREHELHALMDSLRSLRQSAEAQIETLLRKAEIEAERIRDQARIESQAVVERATSEADHILEDAQAIRARGEERVRDVQRLEAEFNEMLASIAQRLGMDERPTEGWLRRLFGSSR